MLFTKIYSPLADHSLLFHYKKKRKKSETNNIHPHSKYLLRIESLVDKNRDFVKKCTELLPKPFHSSILFTNFTISGDTE